MTPKSYDPWGLEASWSYYKQDASIVQRDNEHVLFFLRDLLACVSSYWFVTVSYKNPRLRCLKLDQTHFCMHHFLQPWRTCILSGCTHTNTLTHALCTCTHTHAHTQAHTHAHMHTQKVTHTQVYSCQDPSARHLPLGFPALDVISSNSECSSDARTSTDYKWEH